MVDGYVAGATIFQDLDNDNKLDSGEPFTTTSAIGAFTLSGVISSPTSPIKMISGFDIGTNKAIVTSLGVPTTATGDIIVSPIGTVASIAQAQDVKTNISTIVDRVATYFGVSETSQNNLDLINDDPIKNLKSDNASVVSAAKDAFEANQYMMALAHAAETLGKYVAAKVDLAVQTSLSDSGVSGISTLAGGTSASYAKIGADTFLNQTAAQLSPTGNSINITDETALKVYVGSAAAYEGDANPTAVVYLNHPHSSDVTLKYSFSAKSGDSATAGSDFSAQNGSVTILAGYTSASIKVPILPDSENEIGETFSLEITEASAGALPSNAAKITIYDSSKTIETSGELSSLAKLMVTKVVSDVSTSLSGAYNTYAASNSASWTVSLDTATTAANAILPGLKVIADVFYTIIKKQIDTAAATSDVNSFAEALMISNAATKLFDPSEYIGVNINGDGSYPSGQTLQTLTTAIQSTYNTDISLATETNGDVFGSDTSTNFVNATVSLLTDGNDTETLTSASDIIVTLNGTDNVNAGGGNDKVLGGSGVDTFDGQAGNDHLYGFWGNDILTGGDGNDKIVGGLGDDSISGGAGNDNILAQTGNDIVTSGSGNDYIDVGLGDDIITIDGTGNKTIDGGLGTDTLVISDGSGKSLLDYTIEFNASSNVTSFINGLNRIDFSNIEKLRVNNEDWTVFNDGTALKPDGSFTVVSHGGNNDINGFFSATSDVLKLTYGNIEMLSDWQTQFGHIYGNDLTIYLHNHDIAGTNVELRDSSIGKATIYGGLAGERIDISNLPRLSKIDVVHTGSGDDTILLNPNFSIDTFDGGDGVDTISFVRSWEAVKDTGVNFSLSKDSINFENIQGSNYGDTLTGNNYANVITGDNHRPNYGEGDDVLIGLGGNDTLSGNGGNDQIDGGTGADTITTGSGLDTIILSANGGGSTLLDADTITDFSNGSDVFGLDKNLSFSSLTIAQGTKSNANDAIISISSSGEYLAIVQNTAANSLTEANFTPVVISNYGPRILSTAVTAATEAASYSYTMVASDLNSSDTITYSAEKLPSWLSFNAVTGVLSGTPSDADVGNHSIILTATDNKGAADTQSFTINVVGVNEAPKITSAAVTSINEDAYYNYKLITSDPDSGDTITYAVSAKPSWLNFNTSTGVLSGTPTNDHVGNHSVVLKATDSAGAVVTQSFTVTVSNVNDAPEITSKATTSAKQDAAYSYKFVASDVDIGATVILAASTKPAWLKFNTNTGVLFGTPSHSDVGNHSVVLTATDASGAVTSQSFTVAVTNVNDAPTVTSAAKTSVDPASLYSYTFAANDKDTGDTLVYAAPTRPSWLSFNAGTGLLSGTPSFDDVGSHSVVLTATDNAGLVATQSFNLLVTSAGNNAPTVTSTEVTSIKEDLAYEYIFAAADADSGDILTYAAATKPGWLNFNASTGVLSGTPTNDNVGPHDISLTVTDASGVVVTQSYTLTVINVNDAPTLSVTNGSLTENSGKYTASGTLIGADVDVGTTLTFGVNTTKGSFGNLNLNTSTGSYTYTMDNANSSVQALNGGQTLTENFTVSVSDGVATTSKILEFAIHGANNAPIITSTQLATIKEDAAYTYTVKAADVDTGDSLKYAAPVKPVWLNFNTTTGVLSGTPNNDHVGAHDISLTVTDSSGLKATQAFTLTVTNVNDAPTLSVTNGSLTEDSGSYIASGTLIGKDVDADTTLSYSVNTTTGTYGNLTFNTANGNYTYTMDNAKSAVQALNGSQSLTESFTVSVSDGIAKTSKTLSFVINGANDAPTNLALSANSIAENSAGASVGTLSAKDVDGDTLIYSLASGGDNNSFEISGTTLKLKSSISANYEANNVYDLTIIASDGVASTSLAKEVIVTNVNETSRSSTIYGKAGTNKSASLNEDRNPAIENLMSGLFWGSAGSGIDLTYSFMEPGSKFHPQYGSWVKEKDQVQAASNIFKSTVLDAFELYSSVSLLSFSEISESGNTVAEIRLGTSATSGRSGAFLPNGHTVSGDIWLLSENNYFNNSLALQDGYFWNTTIAHEIGHSLGLEHPFEAASYGNRTYGTDKNIGSVHNALPYSVMAYEEYIGLLHDTNAGNIFSLPTTLMIDDIAALQHLYGVNEQYNSSDTIYTLKSFKDVDRAGNHDRDADYIFASIWDAGGDDTFSWAGQSTVASIDLNAGSFSCFGNITGPDDDNLDDLYLKDGDGILGIAYNAVIENAIGGSNEDTIVGNSAANTLYGGAGAGVKDTLTGNGGADIFVCSLSDASTDLSVADIIFGFTNSSDKIGLEDRTFSDLTISNASGPYSGKTQIVDTNSSKVLFLLDGIDASLIDETDFVVTDFV